ncbi:uncharacterized protein LOC120413433 [Culex pipiens pallens]|uniref:uncharacterized protein LOC120413433 n=1 Tax=Culex pipiens pallens TaxID=42434 RepID=UPI0019547A75|nr:uncharacterized protein LOC120413433 [Culex pipiens pallens]
MDRQQSEQRSRFVAYTKSSIAKSRPPILKHPETLKASNGSKMSSEYSEYRSSYLPYKLTDSLGGTRKVSMLNVPKERRNGLEDCTDAMKSNKKRCEKNNLRLVGETMLKPEYREEFVEFPIEKSQSTPQLNNINFSKNFYGMPSEYKECYKSYDNFTKSAPIKKIDNLSISGLLDLTPEYKDRYQNPITSRFDRPSYLKRKDNLFLDGEFTNRVPEYCSSYGNPNLARKPAKAKPKDTILHLDGVMSYEPVYRCSYIDHPRSRPVIAKPESNIQLGQSDEFQVVGEEELAKFRALPEYRKAKKELLIKPRPPPANKSSVLAQKIINDKNKIGLRQDGHTVSTKVTGPAAEDDPPRAIQQPKKPQSFKYMLENGNENVEKKQPAVDANAPKFQPESNNKPVQLHQKPIFHDSRSLLQRNGTNVVEANTKYVKEAAATGQYNRQTHHRNNIVKQPPPVKPFVVLNAPAKTRNKHWLGPTTIYDSYIY